MTESTVSNEFYLDRKYKRDRKTMLDYANNYYWSNRNKCLERMKIYREKKRIGKIKYPSTFKHNIYYQSKYRSPKGVLPIND